MNNRLQFNPYGFQDFTMLNETLLNNSHNSINMDMVNMNDINNNIDMTNSNLAGSYDGYIRGNLFNSLYDQYKNYKPAKLVPNNEQAELLLNLNQTTFAAHDLRLYLDLHPEDKNMIDLFNKYQIQASNAMKAYERKYGPILSDSPSQNNMFSWETFSFPWEKEDM